MIYICKVCNIEFKAQFSPTKKYCSFKCRNIDYKIRFKGKNSSLYQGGKTKTHICLYCGKKFIDFISDKRKYCSTSCASSAKVGTLAKNWKGGKSPKYKKYNGEFTKELKHKVIKRDKKCVECGFKKRLQVHHIDLDGTNNSLKNLTLLCRKCHGKRHYNSLKKYYFDNPSKSSRKNLSISSSN